MYNNSLKSNHILTKHQYMALMINSVLGVGIITLPESLAKTAHNSAWLSVIIGGIPLIITINCIYTTNKRYGFIPIDELLDNLFGKFLSKFFLLLFIMIQIITTLDITVNMCSLLRTYVDYSIPIFIYIFFIILVSLYSSIKGLNVIAKFSEILLYFITPMFFITLFSFRKGSYLNVLPIIDKGDFKNLIFSLKDSCTAFIGSELSLYFLYFSYHDDKSTYKGINRFIVFYLIFVYTLVTFSVLFILTWPVTEYIESSLIYILEMIQIPLINNFRLFFLILWLLNAVNCVAIHFFVATNITYNSLSQKFKSKKHSKKIVIYSFYVFLLIFSLALAYNDLAFRNIIHKIDTINYFIILLISILCYFISKKKKEAIYYERKK